MQEYVRQGRPVVITGLNLHIGSEESTKAGKECGDGNGAVGSSGGGGIGKVSGGDGNGDGQNAGAGVGSTSAFMSWLLTECSMSVADDVGFERGQDLDSPQPSSPNVTPRVISKLWSTMGHKALGHLTLAELVATMGRTNSTRTRRSGKLGAGPEPTWARFQLGSSCPQALLRMLAMRFRLDESGGLGEDEVRLHNLPEGQI